MSVEHNLHEQPEEGRGREYEDDKSLSCACMFLLEESSQKQNGRYGWEHHIGRDQQGNVAEGPLGQPGPSESIDQKGTHQRPRWCAPRSIAGDEASDHVNTSILTPKP